MGNAVYRDQIQAMVMVQVDRLVLALPNVYKYKTGGKPMKNPDYKYTCAVATTLYSHTRVRFPYHLTVIGY